MAEKTNGKTAKKTPKKAAESGPRLIAQPNGRGAILSGGIPGNKGGGRPKKAFKKFCRELAASKEYQDALTEAATSSRSKNFPGAAKLVASFATSKPARKVIHQHTTTARARLADRLARIVERN